MDEKTLTELLSERRPAIEASLREKPANAQHNALSITLDLLSDRSWRETLPPWQEAVIGEAEAMLRLSSEQLGLTSASQRSKPVEGNASSILLGLGSVIGAAIGVLVSTDNNSGSTDKNPPADAGSSSTPGAAASTPTADKEEKTTEGGVKPTQGTPSRTQVVMGAAAGAAAGIALAEGAIKLANTFPDSDGKEAAITAHLREAESLCATIDNLVAATAKSMERASAEEADRHRATSLEGDYTLMMQAMQELLGYNLAVNTSAAAEAEDLSQRVKNLANSLGNYGLQFVNYDGSNDHLFDLLPSQDGTTHMVWPALCRGDKALLRGRVFISDANKYTKTKYEIQ